MQIFVDEGCPMIMQGTDSMKWTCIFNAQLPNVIHNQTRFFLMVMYSTQFFFLPYLTFLAIHGFSQEREWGINAELKALVLAFTSKFQVIGLPGKCISPFGHPAPILVPTLWIYDSKERKKKVTHFIRGGSAPERTSNTKLNIIAM